MELEIFEMFKVVAVETRIKILDLLKVKGPLGAKESSKLPCITPSAGSHHLKKLNQACMILI